MPTNVSLTEEEEIKFEEGGGLKPSTLYDRKRDVDSFYRFYVNNCNSDKIEDLYLGIRVGRSGGICVCSPLY